jgi:hypothetical protein
MSGIAHAPTLRRRAVKPRWTLHRLRRADTDRAERLAYLERLVALNRDGRLTDQQLSDARRALTR